MSSTTIELYAPVLERLVDLVTKDPGIRYGDALDQAMLELGISIPPAMQDTILMAAFRISIIGLPTTVEA